MLRRHDFTAPRDPRGFTPRLQWELALIMRWLVHGRLENHRRLALRSVWSFAREAAHELRGSALLRPLLTSRSTTPRSDGASPLQAQGEISPGKIHRLPCTSAGFTVRSFGRESFAVISPLALHRAARYPVAVRHPAGLAPRCFQHSPHGRCLAVHSGRRDQLPRGLPPPSRWSCWAH